MNKHLTLIALLCLNLLSNCFYLRLRRCQIDARFDTPDQRIVVGAASAGVGVYIQAEIHRRTGRQTGRLRHDANDVAAGIAAA